MIEYIVTEDHGKIRWYNENRKLHRVGAPAVEFADGYRAYWINGVRHRFDGPARIFPSGKEEYYIGGQYLTKDEFIRRTVVKELTVAEISVLLGCTVKVVE